MTEPIKLLSHDELDDLVDTDPLRLRDEAFTMRAEIERLNAAVELLGTELQRGSTAFTDSLRRLACERDEARMAIGHALKAATPEAAVGFLADYVNGVGGMSSGLPDGGETRG